MNGVSYLTMFLEPVKPWLDDPAVSEIMINGPKEIYIEKSGRLIKVDSAFPSEPALFAAANNIAKSVGRILNEEYPRLDARLPDGSRVHVVIPPLSRCGTVVAIRKFRTDSLQPENLIEWGSISEEMLDRLRELVRKRMNILVCGATSSGKTSILNVLSSFIDPAGSKTPANSSCASRIWFPSRLVARTRTAGGRSPSVIFCIPRCACAPTGSSSAKFAAGKRSICFRQ